MEGRLRERVGDEQEQPKNEHPGRCVRFLCRAHDVTTEERVTRQFVRVESSAGLKLSDLDSVSRGERAAFRTRSNLSPEIAEGAAVATTAPATRSGDGEPVCLQGLRALVVHFTDWWT